MKCADTHQTWALSQCQCHIKSACCENRENVTCEVCCSVDVQWFQERSSQALPNAKELYVWNDFMLPIRLQECLQAPLCFLKFLFCTDPTGSIGWPSPAPRLRIDDCFEMHILHWVLCDLLLSSHQSFQHEVQLRHCVFCTKPFVILVFWQTSQFRSFGKWEKHCVYPLDEVGKTQVDW